MGTLRLKQTRPSSIPTKGHEGHRVQVKAHVDADKGSIHIMEVKMLKGSETKKEEMKK